MTSQKLLQSAVSGLVAVVMLLCLMAVEVCLANDPNSGTVIDEIVYPVPYVYFDHNGDGERSNDVKITNYLEAVVDYDKGVIYFKGREIQMEIDGFEISKGLGSVTLFHLPSYDRFEAYVEVDYYNSNTENILQFFEDFEPRFDLLESETGWSAENFHNKKLDIVVLGTTTGCYGGGCRRRRGCFSIL